MSISSHWRIFTKNEFENLNENEFENFTENEFENLTENEFENLTKNGLENLTDNDLLIGTRKLLLRVYEPSMDKGMVQ